MKKALFYEKLNDGRVHCRLCAHNCLIDEGRRGVCGVRENRRGELYSIVYGRVIASCLDPIEKKPLFHFYPGSFTYSIATVGCNFKCLHCQNADISQAGASLQIGVGSGVSSRDVVDEAVRCKAESISYTYTEPTIFFEFAYETARLANSKGLKNIFVTNGYMLKEPLKYIKPYLDAANVDLKFFDDNLYRKVCGGSLEPVLETIRLMKELGIWLEVTTLIIPGYNDSREQLKKIADFLVSVDRNIPWHVSAFYPAFKMTDIAPTSPETLYMARDIGLEKGLKYVYCGNIASREEENTYCPACGKLLVERRGYNLVSYNIKDSACVYCRNRIEG
ncbi:MAG: AmmeMemoRadiSam system radical SAM enzyme, partial [Candidatus Omnitrophica bacterium]|nr:AmmeMemoRadiSam system radical SAM enzyme [Candidatus Omnitrophota bacterium]